MWSSTSDNKNKEELEDCRCGSERNNLAVESSSKTTAAGASTAPLQQQKQQQQINNLNTFDNKTATTSRSNSSSSSSRSGSGSNFSENNSNISQANIIGGNIINEEQQQLKKELEGVIETEDSGFISGPQTENLSAFVDEDYDRKENNEIDNGSGGGGGTITTTTTLPEEERQQQSRKAAVPKQLLNIAAEAAAAEEEILDSGCIDVEYDEEIELKEEQQQQQQQQYNKAKEEQKYEANIIKQQQIPTTTTSSHSADSSAIATVPVNAAATKHDAVKDQMILKHNVDAGMSEWFCNLNLQDRPTGTSPQPPSHQLPHQSASLAGTTLNNLGGGGGGRRRSATIPTSETILTNKSYSNNNNNNNNNQRTQQQQAAGNSATAPINITPLNAWEQFYQQDDHGDTSLHQACMYGYADVVSALIRMAPHPCLFNIQNDEAQTPLHLAALTAQPKILRMLLIAGAEPTVRDRNGNTALHLVCMSGEEQCVRALTIPISASEIHEAHRQYGHRSNDKTVSYLSCARLPSDLEIRNYDGERCVHLAAQAGHIDVLRNLVLFGADINAREGKSGRTPLHIAIECCNEDLANFLLDEFLMKINLETATYAGLTAYQVACVLNKSQMQNVLEKHGAEPLTPPESDYESDMETDLDDSKMYDRFGDPGYFINYNGCNPMTVA